MFDELLTSSIQDIQSTTSDGVLHHITSILPISTAFYEDRISMRSVEL